MPLFRFHRGGLAESLATTVIVNSFDHLAAVIANSLWHEIGNWDARIDLQAYPSENNFDARIGWYTYLVTANIFEADKMHPVGYLSEPFYELPISTDKMVIQ